jgi:hypothetical protein
VREVEESSLLESVTRERIVKTQHSGKRLSECSGNISIAEISDNAVIACSSELCL